MTVDEMSNAFDTMLNSYGNQALFGEGAAKTNIVLDEYEKSLLLTHAQDIIVKSYFTPNNNLPDGGFDDSERRQADFSSLIKVQNFNAVDGTTAIQYDKRSTIFSLADSTYKILCILNEKIIIEDDNEFNGTYVVVPIHYREYDRLMSQDYAQPNKKQMWRLFQNVSGFDIISEIIPHENIANSDSTLKYYVRYVKRPKPIIVGNLDGLKIDDEEYDSESTELEIPPILHRDVVMKAVELAFASRGVSKSTNQ